MLSKMKRWWTEWRARRRRGGKALPEHLQKGQRGEALAEDWLRRELGFRTLHRNWRSGKGEIDLIGALPSRQLVFVEVRSRSAGARVRGAQSLSRSKKKLLWKTADAYLRTLAAVPSWRIDVVEVSWVAGGGAEIEHYSHWSMGPRRR